VPAFSVPLPVPPVLRPTSTGGVDRYDIRQRVAAVEMLPGLRTQIWGYDGRFPGPTIEVRSGRTAIVRHHNELPVPTVVHLHGGVTAPEHDGYPLDLVLPGAADGVNNGGHEGHPRGGVAGIVTGSREHVYPNTQPAATLWYHDHRVDFTGPQVYRGLAGFYLIRDDLEDSLPLPRGEREIPLMIADRRFHADGSFFYPSRDPSLHGEHGVLPPFGTPGVLGDTILVNGAPWPFCQVAAARYRFRVLNASNARSYLLRLDPPPPGGAPITQIGSELGLLPRPVHLDTLLVGPGERYDIVVDFGRYPVGSRVVLRNALGDGTTSQVMRFDVVRPGRDDTRLPETLRPADEPPDEATSGNRRLFAFIVGRGGGSSTINTRRFDPGYIAARPRVGVVERWQFLTDGDHPVHLHLGQFRILDRNGLPPAAQDGGWKDTVMVRGGAVDVAVRYTDHVGKYVMHCHNLEHEDMMMMTNIEVVR
jgi:spore coat protein A